MLHDEKAENHYDETACLLNQIPLHQWMLRTFHDREITTEDVIDALIFRPKEFTKEKRRMLEFEILRPEWVLTRRLDITLERLNLTLQGFNAVLAELGKIKPPAPPLRPIQKPRI